MLEVRVDLQKTPYLQNRFLQATICYDSRTDVPIYIKKGEKSYIVAKCADGANIEEINKLGLMPEVDERVYFKPYFLFRDDYRDGFYPDLDSAIEYVAGDDKDMLIPQDLSMSLYSQFEKRFNITIAEETYMPLRYVYTLSRDFIKVRFMRSRSGAVDSAKKLIANSRSKKELEWYLDNTVDNRFEILDKLMAEKKVDVMFFTSKLGVQEASGLGVQECHDDMFGVLYSPEWEDVYLLSAKYLKGFGREQVVLNPADFYTEKVGDKAVGIEELQFSYGWYRYFGMNEANCVFAQSVSRSLCMLEGSFSLPYHIIGCRAGVYGFEKALDYVRENVLEKDGSVNELDMAEVYWHAMQEFGAKNNIPLKIDHYWTTIMPFGRVLTPCHPYDYPITKASRGVKIDSGVLVKDENGIILAATDIARTLCFEEHAGAVHNKLLGFIQDDIIPFVKHGTLSKEVYNFGIGLAESAREEFTAINMMPKEVLSVETFPRDVGHVMGLQEPVDLTFVGTSDAALQEGVICAYEYQWSMGGTCMGVEDNFLVGKDTSYNLCID